MAVKEICAGSGKYTKGFFKAGFVDSSGDDILNSKFEDLTKPEYIASLRQQAAAKCFPAAHIGVECTTFSIAANPPYRGRESENVGGYPEVLQQPMKRSKVLSANLQADNTALLLLDFSSNGILASAENPAKSMLWDYWRERGWLAKLEAAGFAMYKVHYCYYKRKYQKATILFSNYPIPERACCGIEKHQETLKGMVYRRGKWHARTKLANPYPAGLVKDWVKSVLRALAQRHGVQG